MSPRPPRALQSSSVCPCSASCHRQECEEQTILQKAGNHSWKPASEHDDYKSRGARDGLWYGKVNIVAFCRAWSRWQPNAAGCAGGEEQRMHSPMEPQTCELRHAKWEKANEVEWTLHGNAGEHAASRASLASSAHASAQACPSLSRHAFKAGPCPSRC